jgi:hypothetical protein
MAEPHCLPTGFKHSDEPVPVGERPRPQEATLWVRELSLRSSFRQSRVCDVERA